MNREEQIKEWLSQVDYDFKTAEIMFKTGRYIYCVFMCHLSLEKMLKTIYIKRFNKIPPKIHNLVYFVNELSLDLNKPILEFIEELNRVSIPTRYPEFLTNSLKHYNKTKTNHFLQQSKEVLKCLKTKLKSS